MIAYKCYIQLCSVVLAFSPPVFQPLISFVLPINMTDIGKSIIVIMLRLLVSMGMDMGMGMGMNRDVSLAWGNLLSSCASCHAPEQRTVAATWNMPLIVVINRINSRPVPQPPVPRPCPCLLLLGCIVQRCRPFPASFWPLSRLALNA